MVPPTASERPHRYCRDKRKMDHCSVDNAVKRVFWKLSFSERNGGAVEEGGELRGAPENCDLWLVLDLSRFGGGCPSQPIRTCVDILRTVSKIYQFCSCLKKA